MWAYSRHDYESRAELEFWERFFLDYWLMLHADETHSLFSGRPIGLGSIARIAEAANPERDPSLIRALAYECTLIAQMNDDLPERAPDEPPATKRGLHVKWLRFLRKTPSFRDDFCFNLLNKLRRAARDEDLHTLAFVARRLAAEVGDTGWPARYAFQVMRKRVIDDGHRSEHALEDLLQNPALRRYNVTFHVLPFVANYDVRDWCRKREAFNLEFATDSYSVVALRFSVRESHPEVASDRAIQRLRGVLRVLRTSFRVRTNVCGRIEVRDVDNDGGRATMLSLPTPFWAPYRGGRRGVPAFPPWIDETPNNSNNDDDLPSSPDDELFVPPAGFSAATWHAAQALSQWPEDLTAAASEIWQGIESLFAGHTNGRRHSHERKQRNGAGTVVHLAIGNGVPILAEDAIRHVSAKLGVMSNNIGPVRWYLLNKNFVRPQDWLHSVLEPRSRFHFRRWGPPAPPRLLFDESAGILHELNDVLGTRSGWIMERARTDLEWLYAVRCARVHEGATLLNERQTAHFARLGLELLIANASRAMDDARDEWRKKRGIGELPFHARSRRADAG